eukprot:gene4071-4743_t
MSYCTENKKRFGQRQEQRARNKEAKEIKEFMAQQVNPTQSAKPAESKPMNRKERRSLSNKLFRDPANLVVAGSVTPKLVVPDTIEPPPYEAMRESCRLARDILAYAGTLVRAGVTTDEIDRLVHQAMIDKGAYPSPLGYRGFPKSVCTSINEVLCHGIPDSRPLRDGDIITIDITVYYKGHHGDTAATFTVGTIDPAATKLVQVTKDCLMAGIAAVKPGRPFSDIGLAIQSLAHKHSYSIPPNLTGHGIGKEFHLPPFVFHVVNELDHVIQPGMIFTVEPILAEGTKPYTEWKMWDDQWTLSTVEGGWSAQFEHTVLVTETGVEILTI